MRALTRSLSLSRASLSDGSTGPSARRSMGSTDHRGHSYRKRHPHGPDADRSRPQPRSARAGSSASSPACTRSTARGTPCRYPSPPPERRPGRTSVRRAGSRSLAPIRPGSAPRTVASASREPPGVITRCSPRSTAASMVSGRRPSTKPMSSRKRCHHLVGAERRVEEGVRPVAEPLVQHVEQHDHVVSDRTTVVADDQPPGGRSAGSPGR